MSVTTSNQAQIMESVLADGDLSKLTAEQRVTYYFQVCESLGLNPYTRPFDYITLNGKKVLYAKRDCADQLRRLRNITLAVTDKRTEDDLYIVSVRATDAHGRSDEDFGAVAISGLKGELRANAMLKAITKAKRRVTLSICGMGMNDETEMEGLPGAVIEGIELPPAPDAIPATKPVTLNKAAAAGMQRAPKVTEKPPVMPDPLMEANSRVWLVNVEMALADTYSQAEVEKVADHEAIKQAIARAPADIKRRLSELLANAYGRFAEAPEAEALPEVEIINSDKLAAG